MGGKKQKRKFIQTNILTNDKKFTQKNQMTISDMGND